MNICGHIVNKEGLHICKYKVEAIEKGLSNFSVPEKMPLFSLTTMSSAIEKRNQMIARYEPTEWRAYDKTKEMLQSATVIIHYDDQNDLFLLCDPSPYGLRAVLSHKMHDGS